MTKPLMTNIDIMRYAFITKIAKQQKTTKRAVIEKALAVYKEQLKQDELETAYKKMGNDISYLQEIKENTTLLGTL